MPPACSVIIPVYEDPGYLAAALDSVVAQTVADWEAIVVDDGSSVDHATSVIAGLGDDRIRLNRHAENRGLSAARNTAIREAR